MRGSLRGFERRMTEAITCAACALAAVLSVGCNPPRQAPIARAQGVVAKPAACPTAQAMEELHASAFYFEHGTADVGRQHLERARFLAVAATDPTWRRLLATLTDVSERIDTEPSQARSEVEQVRATLGEWACLAESEHQRFHASLPPIR